MIREYRHGSMVVQAKFKQAAVGSFSGGHPQREVRLIVLHSAECKEVATAAESLQAWSSGPNHPKASWHFAVDVDSITQSVELDDVSWHAGTVNWYSVGIEQAGRASQSLAEWNDLYSSNVLFHTARLLAVLTAYYDIPLDHVQSDLAHAKGICTHADVTRDFKVRGGHTDPGPNYPIESVLAAARRMQLEAVS